MGLASCDGLRVRHWRYRRRVPLNVETGNTPRDARANITTASAALLTALCSNGAAVHGGLGAVSDARRAVQVVAAVKGHHEWRW